MTMTLGSKDKLLDGNCGVSVFDPGLWFGGWGPPASERGYPFTLSAILCIGGTTLVVPHKALSLYRGDVRWWSRTLPGELLDRTMCGVLRKGRWGCKGLHSDRGGVSYASTRPLDPATPVGFADGGVVVQSGRAQHVAELPERSSECPGCSPVNFPTTPTGLFA